MDLFELERLIGDLSISINDMKGGALQTNCWTYAIGWKQPKSTATACSKNSELPASCWMLAEKNGRLASEIQIACLPQGHKDTLYSCIGILIPLDNFQKQLTAVS